MLLGCTTWGRLSRISVVLFGLRATKREGLYVSFRLRSSAINRGISGRIGVDLRRVGIRAGSTRTSAGSGQGRPRRWGAARGHGGTGVQGRVGTAGQPDGTGRSRSGKRRRQQPGTEAVRARRQATADLGQSGEPDGALQ